MVISIDTEGLKIWWDDEEWKNKQEKKPRVEGRVRLLPSKEIGREGVWKMRKIARLEPKGRERGWCSCIDRQLSCALPPTPFPNRAQSSVCIWTHLSTRFNPSPYALLLLPPLWVSSLKFPFTPSQPPWPSRCSVSVCPERKGARGDVLRVYLDPVHHPLMPGPRATPESTRVTEGDAAPPSTTTTTTTTVTGAGWTWPSKRAMHVHTLLRTTTNVMPPSQPFSFSLSFSPLGEF